MYSRALTLEWTNARDVALVPRRMLYPVRDEPPVLDGASQPRATAVFPAIGTSCVGAPGRPDVTVAESSLLCGLDPIEFWAVIV